MRLPPENHVNDSIEAIDDNSWLIGRKLVLSRQPSTSSTQPSWNDSNGGFFELSDAPSPLPATQPHPENSIELPRVYAAGDQSAIWRAGEAFIKIRDLRYPSITREHVTLEFLHRKQPLSFDIPQVLYHGEWDGKYYLVLSRIPGLTITAAWPTMDEELRQHYVARVAEVCGGLAKWKGEDVCEVDGRDLSEFYLTMKEGELDPATLRASCVTMGMNVEELVFYHCDLGPGNVIVDPETRGLGIIDWEIAGYVPREWVRTKFHLSSGMDFPNVKDEDARSDWRRLVGRKLAAMGFVEVIDGFLGAKELIRHTLRGCERGRGIIPMNIPWN
ncbi:kinase-like domain-containing protein [Staphylotrichum tortipilum]|uniref:Kinase-like domain-containing protein n=1 Tax=Staphylotrichum tortipilum TaxID=2831512 RepID=A0AAN6MRT6_9PEZI|nr:kinase-like domain-containing protein [Staphylotrichum longicolle]